MTVRYYTAGESHGPVLTGIIEGIPAGVTINIEEINIELQKRMRGYGRGGRMKIESDAVEILSGLRLGQTLGSPLTLQIKNKDFQAWQKIMSALPVQEEIGKQVIVPRPGHADLVGGLKYNRSDLRDILERASARETAIRVALGAVARQYLKNFGIVSGAFVKSIGSVSLPQSAMQNISTWYEKIEMSDVRTCCPITEQRMKDEIDRAKSNGDSVGGSICVVVEGLPVGLGSHIQWDKKLDGRLASHFMSLPAVKGIEIGDGIFQSENFGSVSHDEIAYDDSCRAFYRKTNHAGGLEGGMTTGMPLVITIYKKPIATLYNPLTSVNIQTKRTETATIERSDTCAVPALAVICENTIHLVIVQAFQEKFGGDSLLETMRNYENFQKQIKEF